ncbi:hypothetical protein [Curtobacterium sp. 20TX0008]|uniref:hypothetical protein n=1 Tax=Curtobacterium sp. 20TX0008 TaxID=3022018 RepID=UPI00232D4FC0|nr:hypothetical protein [Curtobacterium sp. 20TX0008]MDB6425950.1 hypothetical protein [Curtobacterium sp. 20TX0008]
MPIPTNPDVPARKRRAAGRRLSRMRRTWLSVLTAALILLPVQTAYAASDEDSAIAKFLGSASSPISRWNGAMQLHSNFSGGWAETALDGITRGAQAFGISVSSFCWSVIQSFISFASSFNVLDGPLGRTIDGAVSSLGRAILQGTDGRGPLILLGLLIVSAVVTVRSARHDVGLLLRRLGATAIVVSILTVTVAQAGAGTWNGKTQVYRAAPGSPVWFGQQSSRIVSGIIGGASSVISAAPGNGEIGSDRSNLSCNAQLQGMKARLKASKAAANSNANTKAAVSTVNSMYVRSSVAAAVVAQYGVNPYAEYTWCRGFDANATSFGATSAEYTAYAGWKASEGDTSGKTGFLPGTARSDKNKDISAAAPFGAGSDDDEIWAANVAAWAACHPEVKGNKVDFAIDKAWKDLKIDQKGCSIWWSSPAAKAFDKDGKVFKDVTSWSPQDISEKVDDENVRSFLASLGGSDDTTLALGSTAVVVGAIGSVIDLVVFGGLSGGAILAALMAVLFVLSAFIALVRALISRGSHFEGVLLNLRALIGVLVFGAALSLVLAVLQLIVTALIWSGNALLGGAGNPVALAWAGLTPLIAVIGLHLLCKRAGLPSPVTVTGAAAWGKMLTRTGAASAGNSMLESMAGRAGALGRTGARRAASAAGNRLRGQSGSGATAGAAAVGAAAKRKRDEAARARSGLRQRMADAKKAWAAQRRKRNASSWEGRLMRRAGQTGIGAALRSGAGQAGHAIRASGAKVARSRLGRAARSGAVSSATAFRAARSFTTSRTGRTLGNATAVAGGLAAGPIGTGIAATVVGTRMVRQHRRNVVERRQFIQTYMQRAETASAVPAVDAPVRAAVRRPSVHSQMRRGQAARSGPTRATRAIAGRRRTPPMKR